MSIFIYMHTYMYQDDSIKSLLSFINLDNIVSVIYTSQMTYNFMKHPVYISHLIFISRIGYEITTLSS